MTAAPMVQPCRLLLVLVLWGLGYEGRLQPPQMVVPILAPEGRTGLSTLRSIIISGRQRTREYIITREVSLQEGKSYTVADIASEINITRQNLMNTALFVDVTVVPCNWGKDSLDISIEVRERWYWWPLLYLKPIDRNWNVWLSEYDMSLDRVNYGIKLRGDNITGRNDKLNIWLIKGYTEQVTLKYFNPFADKTLRHGYGFEVSHAQFREVNYATKDNRQQFYKDDTRYLRRQSYAGFTYSYRKGSIDRHLVRLGLRIESIDDAVWRLNPSFFGKGHKQVAYPELEYRYQHLDVDYIPYPARGKSLELNLVKRGLGGPMDLLQLDVKAAHHWPMRRKFYLSVFANARIKLPFDQPFVHQSYLGYFDDFLRGYEYYVVDGLAGGYFRNTVRKEIARINLRTGLRSRTYASIPFRFYAKMYGDAGYVYSRQNLQGDLLNNRFLYSGGFGLDIVTIYDWVIRLEYSFNQLGEKGFYLHKFTL